MPAVPPESPGSADAPTPLEPSPGSGAIEAFARAWEADLPRTSFVPGGRTRRRQVLHELTEHLAGALTGTRSEAGGGQHVGQQLVHHGMTDPRIMAASLRILRLRLLQDLRIEGAGPASMLPTLLDDLALGFATALTDHVRRAAEANARDERVAWREHQQQLQDRARYALHHDPATGLPNRALLTEYLDRVLAGKPSSRIAVCLIALDYPGTAHTAAAEAGRHVADTATRLRGLATEHDYFLAQLSDEHFVLVAENTAGPDDAIKAAEAALRLLVPPPYGARSRPAVTVRIGVVEQETAAATSAALVGAARTALRWARSDNHANSWVLFDADRDDSVLRRQQLADELRNAPASSVDLLYQPILRLTDSTITGLHARPRWQRAGGTTIEGREMFALAEEAGMLAEIEGRLLAAAGTQAARWYDAEPAPFVSIDLTPARLCEPGFVAEVASVLDTSALAPRRLQLAVDDGLLRHRSSELGAVLDSLHRIGIVLAANSIGAGQAVLTDTPISAVNLDPALAGTLHERSPKHRSATITMAWIIDMLHDLGFTIIATDVSSFAQYQILYELDCDLARGGYLAHAVPPADIDGLLHRRPQRSP
jgi:predicted signal transduction protein with EAL and GGDEF domain